MRLARLAAVLVLVASPAVAKDHSPGTPVGQVLGVSIYSGGNHRDNSSTARVFFTITMKDGSAGFFIGNYNPNTNHGRGVIYDRDTHIPNFFFNGKITQTSATSGIITSGRLRLTGH